MIRDAELEILGEGMNKEEEEKFLRREKNKAALQFKY
jgi:hypothetical protein